jgi:Mg2+ and Co2+ transporter CorA
MVFDLESVQEAIEEAVDRLSQKISGEDGPIWEKEPEKAAVLQALPKEIAHLEKWVIRNRDIATELQYQLDDAVKEIEGLQLELTQALKDLSSKNEIIKKLKNEFLKTAYEHNKVSHGHAWYPGDEDYTEYLERIDADAHKKAQESLEVVIRGDLP